MMAEVDLRTNDSVESDASIDEVVLFAPSTQVSGGTTVLLNLATAFQGRGIRVHIVRLWPGGEDLGLPTLTVFEAGDLHRSPALRGRSSWAGRAAAVPTVAFKRIDRARALRRLRRFVDSRSTDTAIIFMHVSCKVVLDESGWRRRESGPLLIGQHHSQFESLLDEPWLRSALHNHFADVDAFVALTAPDASAFTQVLDVPCVAIGNPTDGAPPLTSGHPPIAVSVSRLSHEKQLPLLVDMFAEATDTPDLRHWSLDVYGDGDEREAIRHSIDQTGAAQRIHLRGKVTDVAGVYRSASLNMSAASLEGFPMTILEAARAGVPTIAFSGSPGVSELLAHGRGILVPPTDRSAYVEATRTALRDPAALAAIGEQSRDLRSLFSPDAVVARWVELFGTARSGRASELAH